MNTSLLSNFQPETIIPNDINDLSNFISKNNLTDISFFTPKQYLKPFTNLNIDKNKVVTFIEMKNLNKIIDFYENDLVITVETGIKLTELNSNLAKYNQCFYPISNLESIDENKNFKVNEISLIDLIASNNGGFYETSTAGLRHQILGIDAVLPNGKIVNGGGIVVKNVTGFDITKLFIGSHNSLAIPVNVSLRLRAKANLSDFFIISDNEITNLLNIYRQFVNDNLNIAGLEIFNSGFADLVNLKCPIPNNYFLIVQFYDSNIDKEKLSQVLDSKYLITSLANNQLNSDYFSGFAMLDNYNKLEFSFAPNCLKLLLANIPDMPFFFRPKTNRLFYYLENTCDINKIFDTCQNLDKAITLSYCADCLSFNIKRFNQNDNWEFYLYKKYKDFYDPKNTLNPLVSFI